METTTFFPDNETTPFYHNKGDWWIEYEEKKYHLHVTRTIFIVLFAIAGVISVVADLIIAFAILRYRKLRSKNSNKIIFNFVLADAVLMALLPVPVKYVHDLMFQVEFRYLVIIATACVLFVGTLLIMLLLTAYWCIKLYCPNCIAICNIYVIMSILFCEFVLLLLAIGIFVSAYVHYYIFFLPIGICIFVAFIDLGHIIARLKLTDYNIRKDSLIVLINVFFFSKLPYSLSVIYSVGEYVYNPFAMAAVYFAGIIAVINGIYTFVILFYCDEDYNTYLRRLLRCKFTRLKNQETVDQPVKYTESKVLMENGS